MRRYGGTKALDAEIKINFSDNSILMDYSTVIGDAVYDSNTSHRLKDDWKQQTFLMRLSWIVWIEILRFTHPIFKLYQFYFITLVNRGWITSEEAHYDHQMLMRYFYSFLHSTYSETKSGPVVGNELVFRVPTNMFVDYELTGDYKEKISSISIKRRYQRNFRFGRFERIIQDGWDLVFEFVSSPEHGSCIVTSLS